MEARTEAAWKGALLPVLGWGMSLGGRQEYVTFKSMAELLGCLTPTN